MGCLCLHAKFVRTDWPSDYWLTSLVSACPRKVVSRKTIYTYKPLYFVAYLCGSTWVVKIEALFCVMAFNQILGKSPIKWRQRPDMTIGVNWDTASSQPIKTNHFNIIYVHTYMYRYANYINYSDKKNCIPQ